MVFLEEIFSASIGKAISDCVDASYKKIKEADRDRKSKSQNFQTRIYQVIIDAINIVTYNRYKDKNLLYEAAENLLKGFKSNNENQIDVVKQGLSMLIPNINSDMCLKFIGILRTEVSKESNLDLYRFILLTLLEQSKNDNNLESKQINKLLKDITQKLNENNRAFKDDNVHYKIESRTREYADRWNANMFLNDFDKRDENAGINIKLSEVYLEKHLPYYQWGDNKIVRRDLGELLSDYICPQGDNKMLLILGHAGIGKSTLITWITANLLDRLDNILVYKFAQDLKNIDWSDVRLSNRILEELGLSFGELKGKTLILDGFDEISISNKRKEILDSLYGDWIYGRGIENFSLIITCRLNCIDNFERLKCICITLQPWDTIQIKSFCNVFQEKTMNNISEDTIKKLLESKEILGIPLILYMVLSLNISIEREGSIVDIYDKIFSLEGGIYDRCIDNKKFADNHRIGNVKRQIHQISEEIAIWMFENNQVGACIPRNEYEKICISVMQKENQENENIQRDFLIGNYFKLVKHCEGMETEELYFVHRSIYEYFVAETIFTSIEQAIIELTEESQEELSRKIPFYLKQGQIINNISLYLQYKLLKLYKNHNKKEVFYQWWESAVKKMIEKGMFFYTNRNERIYTNIVDKEIQCFYNLIKILYLLLEKTSQKKYILEDVDKEQLEKYIRFRLEVCKMEARYGAEIFNLSKISLIGINLSGVDFSGTNLNGANLSEANLSRANFSRMRMKETNFQGADLSYANMNETNLAETNLSKVNLSDADLRKATFSEIQFKYLREKYNLEGTYIQMSKGGDTISYEEYINEY